MSATTPVFLYGTLRSAEKRAVVLGRDAGDLQAVEIPGFRVVWDQAGDMPVLVEAPEAAQSGVVLPATPADLARLDWYEAAFGYHRNSIATADGPMAVYRNDQVAVSDKVWDFEDWCATDAPLQIEAAAEAMRFFPDAPALDIGRAYDMLMARAASRLRAEEAAAPSAVRRGAGRKGVTLHQRRTPHRGFFAVDALDLTHRRFDGGTERVTREVFLSTDATLVLPYDPVRDQVVLVEQFRAGPFRRGEPVPWCLEPVAGLIDAGETPEECAHREAQEEAGLTFRALVDVPSGYPSPGATAEYYHLFVGLCDLAGYAPQTGGLASEGEDILTHVLALDAALGLLDSGEANVLPLAYLLTWTAAHRSRLAGH